MRDTSRSLVQLADCKVLSILRQEVTFVEKMQEVFLP